MLGREFAETDVAGLAHSHDVGERLHRLLERRVRVVPMALVQIDVVHLQPVQRKIDLLVAPARADSPSPVAVADRKAELGGEHVGVAGHFDSTSRENFGRRDDTHWRCR